MKEIAKVCIFPALFLGFIFWIGQPETDGVICLAEQHWWVMSDLPTCGETVDDLNSTVSSLEEKLTDVETRLEEMESKLRSE